MLLVGVSFVTMYLRGYLIIEKNSTKTLRTDKCYRWCINWKLEFFPNIQFSFLYFTCRMSFGNDVLTRISHCWKKNSTNDNMWTDGVIFRERKLFLHFR